MYRSWKDYLIRHKGNKDLNENAAMIQTIFKNATIPEQCFLELSKHPNLVCLSRAPFIDEIQATYHHASVISSIAQTKAYNYGLVGFGSQANAVRINVGRHFIQSTSKVKIPSYATLVDCSSKEEITSAALTEKKEKLDSYAVLPPVLASEIFDEDDWDAANIFCKFAKKIKKLRRLQTDSIDDIEEQMEILSVDEDDIGNMDVDEDEKDKNSISDEEKLVLEEESKKFYRALLFLWGIVAKDKTVPESPVLFCNRSDTKRWQDEQHQGRIMSSPSRRPSSSPTSQATDFSASTAAMLQMSQNVEQLSNSITANKLTTPRGPDDIDNDGLKRFKKMPLVQKNTIRLLTLTDDMTEDDVPHLKPADTFLDVLGAGSPAMIQEHLNFLLESNGNLGFAEAAACTAARHGFLCSTPNTSSPNGALCIWLYPHETYGERMTAEQMMRFAEQADSAKKYESRDLDLLTKSKIALPTSFAAFHHMLRNVWHITELFGGVKCIGALAWKSSVDHAQEYERLCRALVAQAPHLYTSLCNDYHRRFMTYLRSSGHGKYSKLAFRQLFFDRIHASIEDETYIVRVPLWAQEILNKDTNKQNEAGAGSGSGSGGGNGSGREKKKPKREKGQFVNNQDKYLAKLIPEGVTYQQLFHPNVRKGVPAFNHPDGSTKCNNFHHRGNCHDKCKFSASHAKTLSDDEKEKGKTYVEALLAKYNATNNVQDPVVPNGNPPGDRGILNSIHHVASIRTTAPTKTIISQNINIANFEEQKLDKVRLQSIEKAAQIMRKCLNEKYGLNSWLLHELEVICNRIEEPLEMHSFVFERSQQAAKWNEAIMRENNNDYQKAVASQPNSTITPGSEFRPISALENLLKHREDWDQIKIIINDGVWYPMTEARDDRTRKEDLIAMINRGNHKSATKPNSAEIVHDRYKGEVDRSWMVPLPLEYITSLDDAEVISIGVAFQTSINEQGEFFDKPRITHDLSFHTESGTSVNDRTIDNLLEDCVYGQCLRRILPRIHLMRNKFPTVEILLAKFDLDVAYRRLHTHPKHAVKAITIVEKLAYLLIRLPFGAAAGPSIYSITSEMIFDLAQDLVDDLLWNPKELHSPHSDKLSAPEILPENIEFEAARELFIDIPWKEISFDGYIDDIIAVSLNRNENTHRSQEAVPLIVHGIYRPICKKEPTVRDDPLSLRKLSGEGTPSERKTVFGLVD